MNLQYSLGYTKSYFLINKSIKMSAYFDISNEAVLFYSVWMCYVGLRCYRRLSCYTNSFGLNKTIVFVTIFTALHCMQRGIGNRNSIRPSVCLSVCLSNARTVTKRKHLAKKNSIANI